MAMALISTKLQLVLLFLLYRTLVSFSNPDISTTTPLNLIKNKTIGIHDVLQLFGLPRGLIPDNVKSYGYSSVDNTFTVELTNPCSIVFLDDEVQYETTIKGDISFDIISGITGIHVRKLIFLWFDISQLKYDLVSDTLFIDAGWFTETLPASLFKTIPSCKKYVQQESL